MVLKEVIWISLLKLCFASYHEQYRVPSVCSERWESYNLNDKEYIIQNLPVTYENAKIMCRGQYNASLAILDSKDKAEFLAEVLSESMLTLESVWVGARRSSAEDPAGYMWSNSLELRRTAADILPNEDDYKTRHYPLWLNRTRVPVPEGGADCVALERVDHDKPVFLDLPCSLLRGFVCERNAAALNMVVERKVVRCKSGTYRVYDGKLNWSEAAAYCVLRKMTLANIPTMKCLKKLGMTMLKTRPKEWNSMHADVFPENYDLNLFKAIVNRHFLASSIMKPSTAWPSDDFYYYVLVKQQYYWQHAYENCQKMNGSLASIENSDVLLQLLLVMGENKDEPIDHVWISGRLNMSKDVATDAVAYSWFNPSNDKRIPDPKNFDGSGGIYMPPWLDENFSMDDTCLNLDRQDHLNGLVYGLPCDTPQYSVCMIEKSPNASAVAAIESGSETT